MNAAHNRILIVEDEPLIAMELELLVEELGCKPVGPAQDLQSAQALLADGQFDAAILDIVIGRDTSFAIADELSRQGRPWIFTTGYADETLDIRYPAVPVVTKPCPSGQLSALIAQMVQGSRGLGKALPELENAALSSL